ncbi:hypothetical protein DFH28DRAFT_1135884 [Melampsora americana]|nr:hypothetical protein DFH28DRAFT_1135884 [Melampsora americana]
MQEALKLEEQKKLAHEFKIKEQAEERERRIGLREGGLTIPPLAQGGEDSIILSSIGANVRPGDPKLADGNGDEDTERRQQSPLVVDLCEDNKPNSASSEKDKSSGKEKEEIKSVKNKKKPKVKRGKGKGKCTKSPTPLDEGESKGTDKFPYYRHWLQPEGLPFH